MTLDQADKLILETGNGILEYYKQNPNLSEDERGIISEKKIMELYEKVKEHFDSLDELFIYLNEVVRWERSTIKPSHNESPYERKRGNK